MGFLDRVIQRAGDRIMYALGSDEAEGRLRAGVVADKLHKDWAVHRGATNGRKDWAGFVRFMDRQYGVELDPGIFDANTSGEDLDQIIAHVAGQMLANGQAEFADFWPVEAEVRSWGGLPHDPNRQPSTKDRVVCGSKDCWHRQEGLRDLRANWGSQLTRDHAHICSCGEFI